MEALPKDPVMLLSVVNTKLRDIYPSVEAMCRDLGVDEKELTERLAKLDYRYSTEENRFL